MKIVFAGCSYTAGGELENPEEERFSRLVCNRLGAEEYNVSRNGYSNDLLFHKFLKFSTTCGKPDVAVIQWTHMSRWQMWDDDQDDWETLNINKKYKLQWNAVRYYRHVYTDQHGIENYWKNVYLAKQYCKDNDIKLIMMNKCDDITRQTRSIDYVSPYQSLCKNKIAFIFGDIVPFSKSMTLAERQEYWMEHRHPSPKGHQLIADYLIQCFDNLPG